jgi:predicted NUDIX family NTP pyrophosphohydrolase
MVKRSAAILLYRMSEQNGLEILIAHMGGPFWAKKDARAWSIPKGEYEDNEDPLEAARREFEEEMGSPVPYGDLVHLGDCRQPSGKIITTWAVKGDFDLSRFRSNTFAMEWPKGSGQMKEFPEVDHAEWMVIERASHMLVKGQVPIVDSLRDYLLGAGFAPEDITKPSPGQGSEMLF